LEIVPRVVATAGTIEAAAEILGLHRETVADILRLVPGAVDKAKEILSRRCLIVAEKALERAERLIPTETSAYRAALTTKILLDASLEAAGTAGVPPVNLHINGPITMPSVEAPAIGQAGQAFAKTINEPTTKPPPPRKPPIEAGSGCGDAANNGERHSKGV